MQNEDRIISDIDTGEELSYAVDEKYSAELERVKQESEDLRQLKESRGWALVNSFLEEQIRSYSAKLVTEDKFSEIRRLQEYLKAVSQLLGWIDVKIHEASKLEAIAPAHDRAESPDNQ